MNNKISHKSFHEITNSYNQKVVREWVETYPELKDCRWIASEKLHGSNFGIHVAPEGAIRVQKRSSVLSPDENFYGYQEALAEPAMASFLVSVQEKCKKEGKELLLFGELFGTGVQKGIKYVDGKAIRFFDLYDKTESRWWTPEEAIGFFKDLYVPVICIFEGIVSALDVNIEFNSKINPIEGNLCEGVVIRPYDRNLWCMHDAVIFKKKNEKFSEVNREPREHKPVIGLSEEQRRLSDIVCSYVTENRMEGVFSKEGKPSSMRDFPHMIEFLVKDIHLDCFRDHEEIAKLDKKEQKVILQQAHQMACTMLKRKILGV